MGFESRLVFLVFITETTDKALVLNLLPSMKVRERELAHICIPVIIEEQWATTIATQIKAVLGGEKGRHLCPQLVQKAIYSRLQFYS